MNVANIIYNPLHVGNGFGRNNSRNHCTSNCYRHARVNGRWCFVDVVAQKIFCCLQLRNIVCNCKVRIKFNFIFFWGSVAICYSIVCLRKTYVMCIPTLYWITRTVSSVFPIVHDLGFCFPHRFWFRRTVLKRLHHTDAQIFLKSVTVTVKHFMGNTDHRWGRRFDWYCEIICGSQST